MESIARKCVSGSGQWSLRGLDGSKPVIGQQIVREESTCCFARNTSRESPSA
jgi:hypothetical protein